MVNDSFQKFFNLFVIATMLNLKVSSFLFYFFFNLKIDLWFFALLSCVHNYLHNFSYSVGADECNNLGRTQVVEKFPNEI